MAAVDETGPTTTYVERSRRELLVVFSGLMTAMFLAALDQTIVATAIRTIADDLNGQTAQAWVTTAYLITATISTPLYGKLSDIYGRRPLYLIAITVFLVGSALCGWAGSIYELAGYRALQGLGAGGLMSLAFAIIGDLVPPRDRGRYQGLFVSVFGVASVVGPVVGGFFAGADELLGAAGWRWVFLVNIPIGLVALVVVSRVLDLPRPAIPHRIDYPGAAALAVALVPLLVVAEQGRDWGWTSGRSLSLIVFGIGGLVAFVVAEHRMGEDALLPLRLLRRPVFRVANTLNFLVGIGMFGAIFSLPLYLQIVQGYSPTESGLHLLPLMVGIMFSSVLSGQLIARTGRYKVYPVVGLALLTLSLLLLSRIGVDTSMTQVSMLMLMLGTGLGGCMQTLVLAVQNDAPAGDMGVATASATLFRQLGGTLGLAALLSVLFGVVGGRIATAFATASPDFAAAMRDPAVLADPANRAFVQSVAGGRGLNLDDTSFLSTLDPRLARPVLEGFASAMDTVFLVGAVVVGVAFVLSWFLREVPLSERSGLAQQAEPVA